MAITKVKKQFTVDPRAVRKIIKHQFEVLCIDSVDGEDTLIVQFDDPDVLSVLIKFAGSNEDRDCIGIHVHSLENLGELEYHVEDAIMSCFKDGFETIYIHSN